MNILIQIPKTKSFHKAQSLLPAALKGPRTFLSSHLSYRGWIDPRPVSNTISSWSLLIYRNTLTPLETSLYSFCIYNSPMRLASFTYFYKSRTKVLTQNHIWKCQSKCTNTDNMPLKLLLSQLLCMLKNEAENGQPIIGNA